MSSVEKHKKIKIYSRVFYVSFSTSQCAVLHITQNLSRITHTTPKHHKFITFHVHLLWLCKVSMTVLQRKSICSTRFVCAVFIDTTTKNIWHVLCNNFSFFLFGLKNFTIEAWKQEWVTSPKNQISCWFEHFLCCFWGAELCSKSSKKKKQKMLLKHIIAVHYLTSFFPSFFLLLCAGEQAHTGCWVDAFLHSSLICILKLHLKSLSTMALCQSTIFNACRVGLSDRGTGTWLKRRFSVFVSKKSIWSELPNASSLKSPKNATTLRTTPTSTLTHSLTTILESHIKFFARM